MNKNLDIYTDKLSFLTVLIIIYYIYIKKKKIRIFFYTRGITFLFFNKIKNLKNIKIVDISKFHDSRVFLNNKSIFESIWIEIDNFLTNYVDFHDLNKIENLTINKKKIDKNKLLNFFKESSTYLIYFQIKLYLYSKKFSKNNDRFFFIRTNPFNKNLQHFFDCKIVSYFDFIFFYKKNNERSYYESKLKFYLFPFITLLIKVYLNTKSYLFGFLNVKKNYTNEKIFLEVHQRGIDFNDITDFFWLKKSKNKKNITAILYKKYNKNSINELVKNNIQFKYHNELYISFNSFWKILKYFIFILFSSLNFNLSNWKKICIYFYYINTNYWFEVFKNENAKIFFTMIDIDEDKFCKLNAIELNDGISVTNHWSNFPFLLNQNKKSANIILTWGNHFKHFIFSKKFYDKIYNIGYPNDHYFDHIKEKYNKIEDENKFVITYMDNMMMSDSFYSPKINLKIISNFIKILNKYQNVILYLKPKNKNWFKDRYGDQKILDDFINKGKLKVLFNDGENEKFQPAASAAMSDLCVGLGISTTAAESVFYGIPAFHFDNLNIINDFTNNGRNKIFFNNINNLFNAIEDQINYKKISIKECKEIYSNLDCFQDKQSSLRANLIISFIFELLKRKENKNEIFDKLDLFIKDNNFFKCKLN